MFFELVYDMYNTQSWDAAERVCSTPPAQGYEDEPLPDPTGPTGSHQERPPASQAVTPDQFSKLHTLSPTTTRVVVKLVRHAKSVAAAMLENQLSIAKKWTEREEYEAANIERVKQKRIEEFGRTGKLREAPLSPAFKKFGPIDLGGIRTFDAEMDALREMLRRELEEI